MFYILIILAVVALEYKLKNHIERSMELGEKKVICNGKIILKKQYNRGMFLNYLEDRVDMVKKVSGVLLGILVLVFAFLLPRKGNRLLKLGLSLCLGGAISNVADRMQRGHVVDYFSFNCNKLKTVVFNISDMCIFAGSFLIFLSSLFSGKVDGCFDEPLE